MSNPPRPNEHLIDVRRDSDCQDGRRGFVCLDRNERPGDWPDDIFREMLGKLDSWDFTHYPDLAPLYRRLVSDTRLSHQRLCVGGGSDALIRRAFQAFLRPGDTVLAPDPTYGMYPVWTKIFQGKFVGIPYRDDLKLPLDKFISSIASLKPRIVVLANADQPTGSMLSREEVLAVVDACAKIKALCIIDEAYYPFSPVSVLADVPTHANLLVLRSLSKAGGIAGLRVGYAAADPSIVLALHAVRSPGEVNSVGAVMATFLLDRPELIEIFRQDVEASRRLLVAAAEAIGFECPKCYGNFQLLRVPAELNPAQLIAALEQRKYLIKGGFSFPALQQFVRVTLDAPSTIVPFIGCLQAECARLTGAAS